MSNRADFATSDQCMMVKSTPSQSSSTRIVSYAALHRFTARAFQQVGLSEADASTGADVLALTDAWGTFTHGTKSLRGYLRRLKAGGLRPEGKPRLAAEGPAWATVDGDSALAMITSTFAMQTAIAKARKCGIAYVGVRNSCHYGAAGCYAWQAAREGLIGLSMANDAPSVAGKVYVAQTRGEQIPNTWLFGADGKPTTDASGYPHIGALQPAAGHKGYGIALLIETLAGVLSGAAITRAVGSWMLGDGTQPTNHGAAFIAIDVNSMISAGKFIQRVESLVEEIHNAPRAESVDRIYVPGEMEWERYDRSMQEGIALPSDVVSSLEEAAKLSGLDLERELE